MAVLRRLPGAAAAAPTVARAIDGNVHFYATCPRGLAGLLAEELTALGAQNASADEAGVAFEGPSRSPTPRTSSRVSPRAFSGG